MRLFVSPASPFARKCRIVIREKGLSEGVEEVAADPYADDPGLLGANPIAQVPALEIKGGRWLSDSPLICAYLDSLADGPSLVPDLRSDPAAHWDARWRETLADSALEMAVKLVLENRRPESERSPLWQARWSAGLHRALDRIEAEAALDSDRLDLGTIALGVVGPYLELRHPALRWREAHPRLAALCDALDARLSFAETRPA